MTAKAKFKPGDIVFTKVYNNKYYGKVIKVQKQGSADEIGYIVSGFGDSVLEKYLKKSTRKSIPKG